MAVREEGPGIGIWIALCLGLVAAVFAGWPLGGWVGAIIAFVVVSVAAALLVS